MPSTPTAKRSGWSPRLAALFNRGSADDEKPDKATRPRARREHAVERTARSSRRRSVRTARRPATVIAHAAVRAHRSTTPPSRPATGRGDAARPASSTIPSRPRRGSSRQPRDPDLRGRPPREIRRDPHARRARPTSRSSRFDPVRTDRALRRSGLPRRDAGRRRTAATATHHPISQVRYRKAAGGDEPLDGRPRRPRKPSADSWEFDA